jgi:prepilin-type N-terminal cleavage/methylation domain-containing protein
MQTTQSTAAFHAGRARQSGFTLIELVVAIAVMAILIGISVPRFARVLEQSRADFAAANLRAIWAAQRLYWLENHVYTDKLSQASPSPLGLFELGLVDPQIVSTTGDYAYTITSANSNTFQAAATRSGNTCWRGAFTIDQTGTVGGTLSAAGEPHITPGFQ